MTITVSTLNALQKLDINRNGLTVDELRKTDTDRNGSLSATEAKAAGFDDSDRALLNRHLSSKGNLPTASAFVFTGDEMRTLKAIAPLHTHFESLDSNHDQLLSSSELGKALGNPRFKGEESAAITAAYKHISDFKSLSEDTNWLPKLPENKYLDKLPLHTYDERGISRKDLERFLELSGKGDSRVSEALGRFSMASYPPSIAPETFPKGLDSIRPDHISQGEIGDCYFLAAVASMANTTSGKKQIQNMIKELPDGRVTVTFPGKQPITLNKPTQSELSLYSNAGSDGMWLSILEKAYAHQRNDSAWFIKRSNPYDKIGNGAMLGTGVGAVSGKWADTDVLLLTSTSALRLKLQQAVAQQQVITAGINKDLNPFGDGKTANGLPEAHAYSVLTYDTKSDMITIRNPWGQTEVSDGAGPRDGVDDGTFKMPLSEFKSSFSMISYSGK